MRDQYKRVIYKLATERVRDGRYDLPTLNTYLYGRVMERSMLRRSDDATHAWLLAMSARPAGCPAVDAEESVRRWFWGSL